MEPPRSVSAASWVLISSTALGNQSGKCLSEGSVLGLVGTCHQVALNPRDPALVSGRRRWKRWHPSDSSTHVSLWSLAPCAQPQPPACRLQDRAPRDLVLLLWHTATAPDCCKMLAGPILGLSPEQSNL